MAADQVRVAATAASHLDFIVGGANSHVTHGHLVPLMKLGVTDIRSLLAPGGAGVVDTAALRQMHGRRVGSLQRKALNMLTYMLHTDTAALPAGYVCTVLLR